MPAAMTSMGVIAGRHRNVGHRMVLARATKATQENRGANSRDRYLLILRQKRRAAGSRQMDTAGRAVYSASRFYLGRAGGRDSKTCPVRCFKAPNWVHCPISRRRKMQLGLSIPEQRIRGWGALRARPGCSDDCEVSYRFP